MKSLMQIYLSAERTKFVCCKNYLKVLPLSNYKSQYTFEAVSQNLFVSLGIKQLTCI